MLLTIHSRKTTDLLPNPNNPKEHPPEQVAQIAASIQAFGFNDPIAIDEQNVIIEGHGRLLAAQKLGLTDLPVIILSHLSEAQQTAYLIAHNKLTLNSEWDLQLLEAEMKRLEELGFDELSLTGFQDKELELLFEAPELSDTEPLLLDEPEVKTCPHCGEVIP